MAIVHDDITTGAAPYITPAEIASHLRVSISLVCKMLSFGVLPGRKVGKLWRVKREDFEQWEQNEVKIIG
jgi:excisionase family DNA binding protein